jgi:hypothetical protein
LYSCGWEMTVTIGSHLVGAELRCPARPWVDPLETRVRCGAA